MYTDINCCNIGHTQIEISRKSVLVYFVHQFFDGVGLVLLLILDFMGERTIWQITATGKLNAFGFLLLGVSSTLYVRWPSIQIFLGTKELLFSIRMISTENHSTWTIKEIKSEIVRRKANFSIPFKRQWLTFAFSPIFILFFRSFRIHFRSVFALFISIRKLPNRKTLINVYSLVCSSPLQKLFILANVKQWNNLFIVTNRIMFRIHRLMCVSVGVVPMSKSN